VEKKDEYWNFSDQDGKKGRVLKEFKNTRKGKRGDG